MSFIFNFIFLSYYGLMYSYYVVRLDAVLDVSSFLYTQERILLKFTLAIQGSGSLISTQYVIELRIHQL